jgi:hypothetical protein
VAATATVREGTPDIAEQNKWCNLSVSLLQIRAKKSIKTDYANYISRFICTLRFFYRLICWHKTSCKIKIHTQAQILGA